jgi:acyl carrier protein
MSREVLQKMSEHRSEKIGSESDKSGDPRERYSENSAVEKRRERIYDDVISMVTRIIDLSPTDITPQTDILYDLGLDSLQIYELVVDLEDMYDIRLPDEDLERLHTVSDVVDLVYTMSA